MMSVMYRNTISAVKPRLNESLMESSKRRENETPDSLLNRSVGTVDWQRRPKSTQNFLAKSVKARPFSKPRASLKKKTLFKAKANYALTSTIGTQELSPISVQQRANGKRVNIHIKNPIKFKTKMQKNSEIACKLFGN